MLSLIKMITSQIVIFILYITVLIYFSSRWKADGMYSLNGDLRMLEKDNVLFDIKLKKELKSKALATDIEKCEWTLDKLKDMFQFFNVADVSLWPYQLVVSFLGSVLVCYQLSSELNFKNVLSVMFMIFVLIDLPRRFFGFHKNALISNKALNMYNYYYKNMKSSI